MDKSADKRQTDGDFPTFQTSDFAGEGSFHFDLVPLEARDDIPRGFPHRHDYYHLLWMSRAQGRHMLDFEHYEVRDHSVFFLVPGQLHAWRSSVPPEGYVMNISTDFFAQMLPRTEDIMRLPFFHLTAGVPVMYLSADEHDALLPLLQDMEREMCARQIGRFDVVRSYLLILLTRLRRLSVQQTRPETGTSGLALARRFARVLEDRYLQYSAIGDYARELNVSERQLNEAVKKATGNTVSKCVQARITLEAKRLLTNTDIHIGEIAYRLNFEDPAYFSRFFKKHVGHTPLTFRAEQSRLLD